MFNPQQYPFERKHYRIAFPEGERPQIRFDDDPETAHELVDCSEGGLRYLPSDGVHPTVGTERSGVLRFRRGRPIRVEGEVVRIQDGEVALQLAHDGIPFPRLWAEQMRLRSRYPQPAQLVSV